MMKTTRHIPARLRHTAWFALLASVLLLGALPLPAHAQGGEVPASYRLNGMQHTYQTWNNCGGANLTMALSYFGWGFDQDIARAWLKPFRIRRISFAGSTH